MFRLRGTSRFRGRRNRRRGSGAQSFDQEPDAVHEPFLVGLAIDKYLKPKVPIIVSDPGLVDDTIKFGADVEFGFARKAPGGQSVGISEATLETKMRKLLSIFASGDRTGMAKRLFNAFLDRKSKIEVFSDDDMNDASFEAWEGARRLHRYPNVAERLPQLSYCPVLSDNECQILHASLPYSVALVSGSLGSGPCASNDAIAGSWRGSLVMLHRRSADGPAMTFR